jgi:hypothetical protein
MFLPAPPCFCGKISEPIAQPSFNPIPPGGMALGFGGTILAHLAHRSSYHQAKPKLALIGPAVILTILTAWFARLLCLMLISFGTVGV